MPEYRVIYVIDVDAESPSAAAQEAFASMVDPESEPPVLEVYPWGNGKPPQLLPDAEGAISIDLGSAT